MQKAGSVGPGGFRDAGRRGDPAAPGSRGAPRVPRVPPARDYPVIEDYALIGDMQSAALVSREGSIDWLCLPRFDSPACFAALLGTPQHGRWKIAPAGAFSASRRYRPDTLVLETEFETDTGAVALVDFMPVRGSQADLVRMVVGRRGRVAMEMEFMLRFDYGASVPWVTRLGE